jgi:hypothetical protein
MSKEMKTTQRKTGHKFQVNGTTLIVTAINQKEKARLEKFVSDYNEQQSKLADLIIADRKKQNQLDLLARKRKFKARVGVFVEKTYSLVVTALLVIFPLWAAVGVYTVMAPENFWHRAVAAVFGFAAVVLICLVYEKIGKKRAQ